MFGAVVDFASLLLAALLVGAMFGLWLIYPAGLDAAFYVPLQQHSIRALNVTMPALGAVTIALTLAAAALARGDRTRLVLLITAALCFAAAGLITRFANQPINAMVMTWSASAPPADWAELRDAWGRWHVLRLVAGIGGLSLVIAAALKHVAMD